MDGRKVLCLMAAVLLGHAGLSWAADAATQAKIASKRDAAGQLTIELKGRDATVRKTFAGRTSKTTLVSGVHLITIAMSGDDVTITAPEKVWRGSAAVPESLAQAANYLRQSTAAIAAKRLLDHTALAANTLEGNAMLLTKAFLGSIWGEDAGTVEYQQWAAGRVGRPRVTTVALATQGPGDCWDKYAAEAIRIMNDYVDCASSCNWRGFFCMNSCGLIYDIRAEGAFMWYMSCNGGFFVD
jgi:hypothetical protein